MGYAFFAFESSLKQIERMGKMKLKRWFGILLCMLLCVGLFPITAFAANETDTWDGTTDTSWYDADSTEFHITTAEQLAGLAALVNANTDTFNGKSIYLENDLDLSGYEWISIGNGANTSIKTFSGLFDGQGHCIYNLYSHEDTVSGTNETNSYRSGLFGTLYKATIQNLGIENADISVSDNDTSLNGKGILVDSMYASNIYNCWTTGTISGSSNYDKYIGVLVGCIYGGDTNNIVGCYSTATITGNYSKNDVYFDSLGGIVGGTYYPTVVISDCWFGGAIVVNSAMAATGGIAGYTEGTTIKNCMVTTTDIGSDGENTLWIAYSVDIAAENCYWPSDGASYGSTVYNEMNDMPAGEVIQDFTSASVLEELKSNAVSGVEWVEGIGHPTFSWDDQNISANYEFVNAAIEKVNALNKDEYNDFSAVEEAIAAVVWDKNITEQAEVDEMARAIENAIAALEYKDADYTAVKATIDKAETLNEDEYKDFSAVEDAIAAVVWDKNITEQAEVDEMARAIEDAIAALEYKDADYQRVKAAIEKASALNKDEYKDFSAVEDAITAVVWDKNITEQTAVDKMAKTIEEAIANLEKKPETVTEVPSQDGNQPGGTTSPETGIYSNITLWVAVLLSAAAAIAGIRLSERKRKYNN